MTIPTIQCNTPWAMALLFCAVAILPAASHAAITIPGADGSDGELHITENTVIDLSLAATGNWDDASPVAGQGVYDPEKWAVVFKYTSVTVDAGVTLSFENHPANPPVVWLVQGTVEILGSIDLAGEAGGIVYHTDQLGGAGAQPGPGGYRGSLGYGHSVWGLGLGGGHSANGSGSFTYSNAQIVPLIGGSGGNGGSPDSNQTSGGAGGGAILIACIDSVVCDGTISTAGGNGYDNAGDGAAGAIRIVCDTFSGSPTFTATRKRIEANNVDMITAPASVALPSDPLKIWLADTDPKLSILSIDGTALPSDPRAQLELTKTDGVVNGDLAEHEIILQGENIPTSATVTVRGAYVGGTGFSTTATFQSGDASLSTWTAAVTLTKSKVLAIQARASGFETAEE